MKEVNAKDLFQPPRDKVSNCRAQPVAETLQGYNDSSGKKSATSGCFSLRDWFCFDDFEQQDDAEWEQDKEREANDISDEHGEKDEQPEEGTDGTISTRISEEAKDIGCKSYDEYPTLADDMTEGKIKTSIFLNKTLRSFSQNNPQRSPLEQHLRHFVLQFSGIS